MSFSFLPRSALGALLCASAFFTGPAGAQEALPKLVVVRGKQALDCPDAQALSEAVAQHMKRNALDPSEGTSPSGALIIEIEGGKDGYTAILRAGDLQREIQDPWKDCSGLASGLPLAIAILLDDENISLSPKPAPASNAQNPSPAENAPPIAEAPPPLKAPQAPPLPNPKAPAPQSPPKSPPTKSKNTSLQAEIGAAFSSGWIGGAVPGAGAYLSLRISGFRAELGGLWLWPQRIEYAPGTVDIGLISAHLGGCARLFEKRSGPSLWGCAESKLGRLTGTGKGYPQNQSAERPWFALGGSLALQAPLYKNWLGIKIRAGLSVLPVVERFEIADQNSKHTVFDPPRLGFLFSAGPTLTIW